MPPGWMVSGFLSWNVSVGMVNLHLAGRALASVSLFEKCLLSCGSPVCGRRSVVPPVHEEFRYRGCGCPHLRVKKVQGSAFQPLPRPPLRVAGLQGSRAPSPRAASPVPSQGSELTQRECSPVGVSKRRVRRGGAAGRGLGCPGHCLDRGQRREASAGPQTLTCRVPGI